MAPLRAHATHLTLPLLVALLIFRLRARRPAYWYRTLLVLPLVVPSIVTYLVWRWFYSYEGLANILLRWLGRPDAARAWLGEPDLALYGPMFVGFPWAGGLAMLIYLAGLQQIPSETIEAAVVDGVGTWSRFRYIELPLILGQVRLLLVLNLIGSLQHSWNGIAWPLLVLNDPKVRTVALQLLQFQSPAEQYPTAVFAGLVIASVPLFVLFAFGMRQFVSGVITGALKA